MKTSNIQTTHAPAIIKGWVRGISASSIADVAGLEWVVMTPTQLAANTNDWAPVDATDTTIDLDAASIIRASTSASWNLTGLVAPNPADEVLKVLENIGTQNLVLQHNVTSAAANRFYCPGDVDLTLVPDTAAFLLYDTISSRWRVTSGGGSGSIPAGTFELAIEGGQSVIKAHGAMGATETFDPTDGNVHTATLDANCTFTLNVPTGSGASTLELYLTQDGTGSRLVTWPGSVIWPGGTAPTLSTAASSVDRIILETLDGGTNWYGLRVGGGVTSVAVTVPAEFSVSGSPITSSGTFAITKATESANAVWAGPTSGSAAQPAFRALVAADIPAGVGQTDHEHINNIQYNGDGSTVAFELPAAPFDAYSVVASVAGVIQDVVLSGTMLTTMTFASAPGAGTNNVRVDIVAVAV